MGAAQAAAETLVVVIKVDEADKKILGRKAPEFRPYGRGRGGLREEASVAGAAVSGFFEGLAHPIDGWRRIFNGTAGR
jgi:hypothetical protein